MKVIQNEKPNPSFDDDIRRIAEQVIQRYIEETWGNDYQQLRDLLLYGRQP